MSTRVVYTVKAEHISNTNGVQNREKLINTTIIINEVEKPSKEHMKEMLHSCVDMGTPYKPLIFTDSESVLSFGDIEELEV